MDMGLNFPLNLGRRKKIFRQLSLSQIYLLSFLKPRWFTPVCQGSHISNYCIHPLCRTSTVRSGHTPPCYYINFSIYPSPHFSVFIYQDFWNLQRKWKLTGKSEWEIVLNGFGKVRISSLLYQWLGCFSIHQHLLGWTGSQSLSANFGIQKHVVWYSVSIILP